MSTPATTPVPTPPGGTARGIDVSTWSDVGSRDALDLVTAAVAEFVGFEVAAIGTVRGDKILTVSIGGETDAHASMLGTTMPIAAILAEFDRADHWGRWRFVPHDRMAPGEEPLGWVPDLEVSTEEDAWHPYDLLAAPLHDEEGELIGLLSIDLPIDRRRPGPRKRDLLERYAVQAERTLRLAQQRHDLAERSRLAETARSVVAMTLAGDDPTQALHKLHDALLEGFRADEVQIRTYASASRKGVATNPTIQVSLDFRAQVQAMMTTAWTQRWVHQFAEGLHDPRIPSYGLQRDIVDQARIHGMGVVMAVPIGAGGEALGHLLVGRADAEHTFTGDEQDAALSIARDIGHALMNHRILVHEQSTVADLRQLTAYKSQLLATVSHELKNPLGAMIGHLEMLHGRDLSPEVQKSVGALERAANRMQQVVSDLLTLASVEDPDRTESRGRVALGAILTEAVELLAPDAERRRVRIDVHVADDVWVRGRAEDHHRVVANLLSNAVKYSLSGGTVTLELRRDGDQAVLTVSDQGIGISEADQQRLFTEFFRSTNPRAVAQPGTGLGLAIAARTVEGFGGQIEVSSSLGEGSTFRVVLPAA